MSPTQLPIKSSNLLSLPNTPRLTLQIVKEPSRSGMELTEITFSYGGVTRISRRGKGEGFAHSSGSFGWTSAVRALAVILVRARAQYPRAGVRPLLSGGKGSLAASLDDAIYKSPRWIEEIFGSNSKGELLIRRILIRSNPGRKRAGDVSFHLNDSFLQPSAIDVIFDGSVVHGTSELEAIATNLLGREAFPSNRSFVKNVACSDNLVHFICPADTTSPFYGRALARLISTCMAKADGRLQVVPLVPPKHFAPYHLWRAVDSLIAGEIGCRGIVLIADQPDLHTSQLCALALRHPTVLFDVDVGERESFKDALPPFVGGQEFEGGRLAGSVGADYLTSLGITNPHVLILQGATTKWESYRAEGFSSRILAEFPSASLEQSPPLLYERTAARRYLLDRGLGDPAGELHIDLIFACNDDMALGARNALVRLRTLGVRFPPHLKIIGYDAVREMQDLLETGDELLLSGVDVSLDRQIDLSFELLQKLMNKEKVAATRYLISPKIVLNSNVSMSNRYMRSRGKSIC